jgi:ComF family protein
LQTQAETTDTQGKFGAVRNAAHAWKALSASAFRLLVPEVCLCCRARVDTDGALCANCWRGVNFIRAPYCDRLGIPMPFDTGERIISAAAFARPPAYDRARAVAHFDGTMRRLIHGLKYSDRHDCVPLFGRWLAVAGAEILVGADMLAPVPLNRWRLLRRRFNQAALLARELGQRTGLAFEPEIVTRPRRTRSQVGLKPEERRKNVSGAFAVARGGEKKVAGRNIVIVDDVITTGATAEAMAKLLKAAGAARVDVLALARVTDPIILSA